MITLRDHLRAKGTMTVAEMRAQAAKLKAPEAMKNIKILIRDEVDAWPRGEGLSPQEFSKLVSRPRQIRCPLTVVQKGSFVQVKSNNK